MLNPQAVAAAARIPTHRERARQLGADLAAKIEAARKNPNWSGSYIDDQVRRYRDAAATALAGIRGDLDADVATVRGYVPPPLGPADPVVRELQLSRAWERARDLMAGGLGLGEVATQAAASKDPMLLAALREQGPAKAAAMSAGSTAADRQQAVETFMHTLDTITARDFADTDEGQWVKLAMRAEIQARGAEADFERARRTVEGRAGGDAMAYAVAAHYLADELAQLERDTTPVAAQA